LPYFSRDGESARAGANSSSDETVEAHAIEFPAGDALNSPTSTRKFTIAIAVESPVDRLIEKIFGIPMMGKPTGL
jgi:hypothetical protein